jgi:hypothetical protein
VCTCVCVCVCVHIRRSSQVLTFSPWQPQHCWQQSGGSHHSCLTAWTDSSNSSSSSFRDQASRLLVHLARGARLRVQLLMGQHSPLLLLVPLKPLLLLVLLQVCKIMGHVREAQESSSSSSCSSWQSQQ